MYMQSYNMKSPFSQESTFKFYLPVKMAEHTGWFMQIMFESE